MREELNVRRVRFVAAAEELGSYEVKANYRTLGPLFGKDMPLAAEAIAALDRRTWPRRCAAPAPAPARRTALKTVAAGSASRWTAASTR